MSLENINNSRKSKNKLYFRKMDWFFKICLVNYRDWRSIWLFRVRLFRKSVIIKWKYNTRILWDYSNLSKSLQSHYNHSLQSDSKYRYSNLNLWHHWEIDHHTYQWVSDHGLSFHYMGCIKLFQWYLFS